MSEFSEHAEVLDDAYQAFTHMYHQTRPLKVKPSNTSLGWMFYFMAVILVSQVLLAALRTSDVFYVAAYESSGSANLARAEAFLAIIAIELGMVAYAMQDAVRNKRTEGINGATTAIIVMLGISIAAGLLQSISIIQNIHPTFLRYLQYSVSVAIGVGASYVAFIGGKYLGVQIVIHQLEQENINAEYQEYLDEYNDALRRSWTSSKEYRIARGGLSDVSVPQQQQYVFASQMQGGMDYRNLSADEQEQLQNMTTKDIMDVYSVIERTAQNWKSYSRRDYPKVS